jgi:energy-coupling factor transporter ATP-binding protein EcfA2
MKISQEKKEFLKLLEESNESFFITGKAGTGKSTLLKFFREQTKKKTVVLAPTGISAINVDGETIHSFFKLKPGFELDEARNKKKPSEKNPYEKLQTIIIDEISMVRADLLDAIDIVLRTFRGNFEPFGGVQMIFFGDLYQLPPVLTKYDEDKFKSEGYDAPYFLSAKVFDSGQTLFTEKFKLKSLQLKEIHRQQDDDFIQILNGIRNKNISQENLDKLNECVEDDFYSINDDGYIYLMTTNANSNKINQAKLAKLSEAESEVFSAKISGDVPKNLHPNDLNIEIKVGAQVMFIQNDAQRRWVNGTIGTVLDIYTEEIEDEETGNLYEETIVSVEKRDGEIVEVSKSVWEISKYISEGGFFSRQIMGKFHQIPLKLAWAITIHKSQGKTFEKVIIDLGWGSFVHGQVYVALSRCTNLNGLILTRPLKIDDIIMDKRIEKYNS